MKEHKAIFSAVLAAALYALSAPVSKLLLQRVEPSMMAALLYLGAGLGMLGLGVVRRQPGGKVIRMEGLGGANRLYTIGMVLLDIAAPILLMLGIRSTSSANASLLNNFEIVATSLIALCIFGERISRRLGVGIGLIVLSSVLLTVEDASGWVFSGGSVLVLLASCCWGLENNCTRMLSQSDPQGIVVVKGLGSGLGAMLVALLKGEAFPDWRYVPAVLLLGFVAYGLSIFFYVYAQRDLGAARTSAYYAIAPFIGVLLSLVILREWPGVRFYVALAGMIAATLLVTKDRSKEEGT